MQTPCEPSTATDHSRDVDQAAAKEQASKSLMTSHRPGRGPPCNRPSRPSAPRLFLAAVEGMWFQMNRLRPYEQCIHVQSARRRAVGSPAGSSDRAVDVQPVFTQRSRCDRSERVEMLLHTVVVLLAQLAGADGRATVGIRDSHVFAGPTESPPAHE